MKKIILFVGVVAVLFALGVFLFGVDHSPEANLPPAEVAGDPTDAALEFYNEWLSALWSTTTDPMAANLTAHTRLSDDVRTYITTTMETPEPAVDPVLCQRTTPPRIGTKVSFITDSTAQILVLGRGMDERTGELAVVDLTAVEGDWQITKISCSAGEVAPDREYSFEREGFLLKSVPPPLNSDYWHIVFEENGVQGHTAPLFFNAESICIAPDGSETVCDESQFSDATPALVQGEMTESGVDVKRVTFLTSGE